MLVLVLVAIIAPLRTRPTRHDELVVLVEWSLAQVLEPFLAMIRGPVQVLLSEPESASLSAVSRPESYHKDLLIRTSFQFFTDGRSHNGKSR